MPVPTPATLKAQLDQKKAFESYEQSSTSTPKSSDAAPAKKKPFVRKEHLTQKPLRENEALQKLAKELKTPPVRNKGKRQFHGKQSRNGKKETN